MGWERVGDWEKDLQRDRIYAKKKKRWKKNEGWEGETDRQPLSEGEPGNPREIKEGSTTRSRFFPCKVVLAQLVIYE